MVDLRLATIEDLPLMFEWRNQAQVFQGFYDQSEPLVWGQHLNWWASLPASQRCFIILYKEKPVGVVNILHLDNPCPEVGYYIGDISLRGKGIATEAVRLVLERLKAQGYASCCATTFKGNIASVKVLERLGFQYTGLDSRPVHQTKGIHLRYEAELGSPRR